MSETTRSRPATRPPPSPSTTRTATPSSCRPTRAARCSCTSTRRPTRPGCTTQSCGLRDIAGDIGDTAILGHQPRHAGQAEEVRRQVLARLPAAVRPRARGRRGLRRVGREEDLRQTYMGIVRSAFLVDEKGKIEQAWYKISPKDTPDEAAEGAGRVVTAGRALPAPADVLPHRPPFLFVDELVDARARAVGPAGCGGSPATRRSSPVTSPDGPRCRGC